MDVPRLCSDDEDGLGNFAFAFGPRFVSDDDEGPERGKSTPSSSLSLPAASPPRSGARESMALTNAEMSSSSEGIERNCSGRE